MQNLSVWRAKVNNANLKQKQQMFLTFYISLAKNNEEICGECDDFLTTYWNISDNIIENRFSNYFYNTRNVHKIVTHRQLSQAVSSLKDWSNLTKETISQSYLRTWCEFCFLFNLEYDSSNAHHVKKQRWLNYIKAGCHLQLSLLCKGNGKIAAQCIFTCMSDECTLSLQHCSA